LESISVGEARSALAWWLEAGVDAAVGDEPRDWLKPAPPRPPKAEARQPEAPPSSNLVQPDHATLTELQSWLSSSAQMPLASADARRILPHGPEEPAVMLLSDAPALEDFAAGQPIGGQAWELACRMLAAIDIHADQAYSASLSCFHTPGVRMSAADRDACAELARQHIRLVKPKGLLLFGDGPSRALLGKPLPTARGHVHKIEGVRTIVTFHPRQLINQPSNKSLAWKDLLLLMEDES
jgi:DNA polymerase